MGRSPRKTRRAATQPPGATTTGAPAGAQPPPIEFPPAMLAVLTAWDDAKNGIASMLCAQPSNMTERAVALQQAERTMQAAIWKMTAEHIGTEREKTNATEVAGG